MAKRKYQKWLLTTVDGLRLGLGVAPAFVGLPLGDFEGDTVGLRWQDYQTNYLLASRIKQ